MRPVRKLLIRLLLILSGWSNILAADTVGVADTVPARLDRYMGDIAAESAILAAELTADFDIDTLAVYCEGATTSRKVKILIYDDNAGAPGNLRLTSAEITLTNGTSRSWYKVAADMILKADSVYWFGAIADGPANVSKIQGTAENGEWTDATGSYASPPTDGTGAVESPDADTLYQICIHAIGSSGGSPPPEYSPRRKILLTGDAK